MLLDLAALSLPLPLQDKYWEMSEDHSMGLLIELLNFRIKKQLDPQCNTATSAYQKLSFL